MNENINNGRGILLQTLYIFGNGFDIAHGIRTPYAAFREFLNNCASHSRYFSDELDAQIFYPKENT